MTDHPLPAFVVPTYNERENLARLVEQLLALPQGIHVIVVDDASPDGTGGIADALAAREARVHVVHRAAKLGIGTAHVAGIRLARGLGLDPIGTMDADFSHHPEYVPAMLAGIAAGSDVMIGSRYVSGGGTRDFGLHRQVLSRTANFVARTVLGLGARDCTAGFRLYSRRVVDAIDLGAIVSDGYSFLVEMLYVVETHGFRVGETPILFQNRREGTSKISRREIFRAIETVFRLRLRGGRLPRR